MITKENQFFSQPKSIVDDPIRQAELAKKLENVYGKRPDIRSFIGAMEGTKHASEYTSGAIDEDERYVRERRRNIDSDNESKGRAILRRNEGGFALSEMMQAMVADQINKGWLSEFSATMTADYDDLKVGVDTVMKHKSGKYVGTSLDFTISNQADIIHNKLDNEWENRIVKGSLPVVKYYQDPDTGKQMSIIAPKFIIGASKKDIEEMATAYLNNDTETLKNHRLQFLIVEQIYEQLVTILDFYEEHRNERSYDFAHKQYNEFYTTIQRIRDRFGRENKINTLDFHEYKRDSVALETMRKFTSEKKSAGSS